MSAQPCAVQCHRHDGWAELVLNRPERRNAIDGLLADALLAQLSALNADDTLRAIVLRGAGGALCSGLDLKAFNAEPPPEWLPRFAPTWHAVHLALLQCPQVLRQFHPAARLIRVQRSSHPIAFQHRLNIACVAFHTCHVPGPWSIRHTGVEIPLGFFDELIRFLKRVARLFGDIVDLLNLI